MVRTDHSEAFPTAGEPYKSRLAGPESDRRNELAAQFIPSGSRVLDLSFEDTSLQRFLPFGCDYCHRGLAVPGADAISGDLDKGEFPPAAAYDADIIVALDVLEYIPDAEAFISHLRSRNRDVVLSYRPTELTGVIDRNALGCLSQFSFLDLSKLFDRHGYRVTSATAVDSSQILMRLTQIDAQSPINSCSVAVISHNDVGNFGDRLGYHIVNSLFPGEATVHHLTFQTLDLARDKYDLVVVGIGNSIFHPLLRDDLLDVVGRGKAAVGIFGTQYRELMPRHALDRLIDRLDVWFARYEDDVLMYGRGRVNVEHLGDWLIDQFPMGVPTSDELLHIDDRILLDIPLDRTIQFIQRHRQVYSTRLHPLLCALTSAETVAYAEQPDDGDISIMSGKFRSMLIDIFGRTYPEKAFFTFDRDAVTRYKRRVRRNVAAAGERLEAILRNVTSTPAV
jgi:hypothetical protein